MYAVYKHLNKEGEVIYVGQTKNMNSRQVGHKSSSPWKDDICKIEYSEVSDKVLMDTYEKLYISKFEPRNNKRDIDCKYSVFFTSLKDLEFKEYIPNKAIRERAVRKPSLSFEDAFETHYNSSIETMKILKNEYMKTGRVIGKYAYIDTYIECMFYIHFRGVSWASNAVHSIGADGKCSYYIDGTDFDLNEYNYLKSKKQLKYKPLNEIWKDIFVV